MVNVEKLSETAMHIITYAGLAKSYYMQGLMYYKEGNTEAALKLIQEGEDEFIRAHHAHGETLTNEMSTSDPQISLLMAHAEDQLMSAETIKIMVMELIYVYKEKRGNKGE